MPALSYLVALLLAFLGINAGDSHDDLAAPAVCDTGQGVAANDYTDDWYAWEWCLVGDAVTDPFYDMTADEARDLVDRLWAQYTPWMQRAFVGTLDGFDDDNDYVYGPTAPT